MGLKVVTDIQCDGDGCTATVGANITGPLIATRAARSAAKAAGWTMQTSSAGVRWYSDFCPEHSPTPGRPRP